MAIVDTDLTEQWSSMQKMFLPPNVLRENARHFWESQDKILDSMQALANGWFERRHAGTHTAREVAERVCGTDTFADLIQAYQEWISGAFERIMKDGLSCQQQIMAATGAFASPPIVPAPSEKDADAKRTEERVPARSKTS